MNTVVDVLSFVLLATGTAMALIAVIGLFRLPGTTMRMHAATKPATLGVLSCAAGAVLQVDDLSSVTKIAVVVAFQFITVPVGAHMLACAITDRGANEPNE